MKHRLVLENDERSYSIGDVLEIGFILNLPVVFDTLHHAINPGNNRNNDVYWINQCRKTWCAGDGKQKIHYSQQDPLKPVSYTHLPSNGREKLPMVKGSDIFHGKCLEGYMGYAADENIRQESQSGGVVTALLCYLLEKNIIGGAVVNQFDGETRRPKAVFATSGEEIIACLLYTSRCV